SAPNILGEECLKNIAANSIKWDKQNLAGLGKKEIKTDAGTIFDLEIGEIVCQPMKTLFCEEKKFQSLCPGQTVQGVLGYEFLKQVHTTINFKEKTFAFRNVNSARNSDLAAKRDTLGGSF
ncbi:MAG: hypothetical protein HKN76_07520, partial [Saprospiraceae bacterium]|nr:hypothetical protein [Saprospiraceae bacterium]